jgi:hypothetical protein
MEDAAHDEQPDPGIAGEISGDGNRRQQDPLLQQQKFDCLVAKLGDPRRRIAFVAEQLADAQPMPGIGGEMASVVMSVSPGSSLRTQRD